MGALFGSVESFLDGSLLLLFFLVPVLGLLESLSLSFDGVSLSIFSRLRGEGDLPFRGWGVITDLFFIVA